jgi:hypothetical protein
MRRVIENGYLPTRGPTRVESDSVLTIKGLIETTVGIPRVHQHLMALWPEIRFNDYTKLGTIWQGLQENNGEVLICTRLNGYAQTSRTMTAQGRAAQEITRMEEHNRRSPYTATRNRTGPRTASHLYSGGVGTDP